MFNIRKANERGYVDHGWLKTFHTFSFGRYIDRQFMGFSSLRVINEDLVAGGQGFDTHPHENMEIITYVLEGALEHKDSMGTGSVIRPGDFQRMSAGSGVTHSEFNHSQIDPVHLYQIWLLPKELNIEPSYEQMHFSDDEKLNKLYLVASNTGEGRSLTINQMPQFILTSRRKASLDHALKSGRSQWLQCLSGSFDINNNKLNQGDGAAVTEESNLKLECISGGEIMLFDLP
ncbi:MAG: pirin family protein [Bdellovibrionota bacterium]